MRLDSYPLFICLRCRNERFKDGFFFSPLWSYILTTKFMLSDSVENSFEAVDMRSANSEQMNFLLIFFFSFSSALNGSSFFFYFFIFNRSLGGIEKYRPSIVYKGFSMTDNLKFLNCCRFSYSFFMLAACHIQYSIPKRLLILNY